MQDAWIVSIFFMFASHQIRYGLDMVHWTYPVRFKFKMTGADVYIYRHFHYAGSEGIKESLLGWHRWVVVVCF